MKRTLTIAVAAATFAAMLSFANAQPSQRGAESEVGGLPTYEIVAIARAHGLAPIGVLSLRWPNYVLHAYDARGNEMRVVIDAQFGDILSVAPARAPATAYTPRYQRGARIIQIPRSDEQDEPDETNDDDVEEVAPPVPHRATPLPKPRSYIAPTPKLRSKASLPLPPLQRRNILNAPPQPSESPLPPQQATRLNPKIEPIERFGAPGNLIVTPNRPPPGYTPPAALPRDVTSNTPPQPSGNTSPAAPPREN